MKIRKIFIIGAAIGLGINSGAEASKQCVACPPGKWTKNGNCVNCKEGVPDNTVNGKLTSRYCPGGGVTYNCPDGLQTNVATATSSADCKVLCGYGQKYNGTNCEPCPNGQYQDSNAHQNLTCRTCPTGSSPKNSTGGSASAACSCNDGLVWGTDVNNSGCCALNDTICLHGNVGHPLPNGVSVEMGCFSFKTPNPRRGLSGDGGPYCHCRARTDSGAVSTWVFTDEYNSDFMYLGEACASVCNFDCTNNTRGWGPKASW